MVLALIVEGCTLAASLEKSLSDSDVTPIDIADRGNFFNTPVDKAVSGRYIVGDVQGVKTFGTRMLLYGRIDGIGDYIEDSLQYSFSDKEISPFKMNGTVVDATDGKVFVQRPLFDGANYPGGVGIYSFDLKTNQEKELAQVSGDIFLAKYFKGHLYFCGAFSEVNGEERENCAIIDSSSGEVSSTVIDITYNTQTLYDIAVSDGWMSLTGSFSDINGTNVSSKVAVINMTNMAVGSVNPTGFKTGFSNYRLAVHDNHLFVGGRDSTNRPKLVRVDLMSSAQVAVASTEFSQSGTYKDIRTLRVDGSHLWVAGTFDVFDGLQSCGLVDIDSNTLVVQKHLTEGCQFSSIYSAHLHVDGNNLIYAPEPYGTGGSLTVYILSKEDFSMQNSFSFSYHDNYGGPESVFGWQDKVYVRGDFIIPKDVTEKGWMIAYDMATEQVLDWSAPQINANDIRAWAIDDDWVYIAGEIDSINEHPTNGLAAFNLRTGEVKTWEIEIAERSVLSMAVLDGKLYFSEYDVGVRSLDLETGEEKNIYSFGGAAALRAYEGSLLLIGDMDFPGGVEPTLAVIDTKGELVSFKTAGDLAGFSLWWSDVIRIEQDTLYLSGKASKELLQIDIGTGDTQRTPLQTGQAGYLPESSDGSFGGFYSDGGLGVFGFFDESGVLIRSLNLKAFCSVPG